MSQSGLGAAEVLAYRGFGNLHPSGLQPCVILIRGWGGLVRSRCLATPEASHKQQQLRRSLHEMTATIQEWAGWAVCSYFGNTNKNVRTCSYAAGGLGHVSGILVTHPQPHVMSSYKIAPPSLLGGCCHFQEKCREHKLDITWVYVPRFFGMAIVHNCLILILVATTSPNQKEGP